MSTKLPLSAFPVGTKVLVVDDHSDTVMLLSKLLQKAGCDVTTATRFADAMNLMGRRKFDLLISDIGLTDGNGIDLMRRARQHQPIKGIALSGFDSPDERQQCEEAGFSEQLVKPVDMPKLLQAIQRTLNG